MKINAIQPIQIKNYSVKKQQKNNQTTQNTYTLNNFSTMSPLKNQILFKGANDWSRKYIFASLQDEYNLEFNNKRLLNQAFIHHSVPESRGESSVKKSYSRLNHVGSQVLQACIAKMIFLENSSVETYELNEISNKILSNINLIQCSKDLGIDKLLLIDKNYLRGREAKKPYADIMRSLVGAIAVDCENQDEGMQKAYDFVSKVFEKQIKKELENISSSDPFIERKGIMEEIGKKATNAYQTLTIYAQNPILNSEDMMDIAKNIKKKDDSFDAEVTGVSYITGENLAKRISETYGKEIEEACKIEKKDFKKELRIKINELGYKATVLKYVNKMLNDGFETKVFYNKTLLGKGFNRSKEKSEEKAAQTALDNLQNKKVTIGK